MTEHGDHDHGLPPRSTVKRWLVTTNHKDVGILYLVTSLFFLIFGGVLALLFRLELWESGSMILTDATFNQAVTAHGLVMVFFFISPFAFGFANYVVPLQIGADDLAFPRLNALSYWLYLFGGLLFGISFFQDRAIDVGWTIYAPLNVPAFTPYIGTTSGVLALGLFTIAVTASTINFLVTIHASRAEGMSLWNMPLFTWSILLTVWMMLFAFAALLAVLLILGADRLVGTVYFQAEEGGSLLWGHLFWFFGHPEVYIVFFPALGVMLETFQTFSGRRIVGRRWVIAAMVLVAIQSFVVWMHHMYLTTINLEIKTIMMATTIGISLPFDLLVFALIYTLAKGRIQFTTPFLFSFGALVLFIIGGITGVFLGAVVLDYEFRGTYWVVAHFHYVMFGGATALFGGLYYWYPKMTGRMYNEFLGKLHFGLFFIGFNVLYFPLFIAWETPRRVFHYADGLTIWHQVATLGGLLVAVSFVIMFYNLYRSLHHGAVAGDNPWDYSRTAEWAIPSPPPLENWTNMPSYRTGKLEFVSESEAVADGGHAVDTGPDPDNYWGHGKVHASHASPWPFLISLGAFLLFLGLSGARVGTGVGMGGEDPLVRWGGLHYVALAVLGLGVTTWALVEFGKEDFFAPPARLASRWPFDGIEKNKLGVWFFIASDIVVFGAFLSAYIFIRVAYGWFAWEPVPTVEWPGLLNTVILLTSSFTVILALVAAERKNQKGLIAGLSATFLLGFTFMAIKAWEWDVKYADGVTVSSGIREAVYYGTTGLHGVHVLLGLAVALFLIARASRGYYLEDHRSIEYFGLYWHFVDIVWVFLFPMFYLM